MVARSSESSRCADFIKRWECNGSPVLVAYWDHQQWSIGYGTKSKKGETITRAEADRRFRDTLDEYGSALDKKLDRPLSENQYCALLSATYNLGKNGCNPVIKLANQGDFVAAANLLKTYNHASGKVHAGLTARRQAEALYLMDGRLRGQPRLDYKRTYRLMPGDATTAEFMQEATAAFASKSTIGFSADDGGIGDLSDRSVVLALGASRHPPTISQWYADHYPGVKVVTPEQPTPTPPRRHIKDTSIMLPGLHGSADGSWGNPPLPDTQQFLKAAKLPAYKALSNEAPDIPLMQRLGVEFVMVRLMGKVSTPDPQVFIDQVRAGAQAHYDSGVRFFEIHNEPNLRGEGWGKAWPGGSGFARWFLAVRDALRPTMRNALWGWPGLSPGFAYEDVRADPGQFMEEGLDAVNQADWLGAHCYWTGDGVAPDDMYSTRAGQSYKLLPRHTVPLLITEYSNPSDKVDKVTKARQYVSWMQSLIGVHSCYSFVASASSGFEHETWTQEMAQIIGARK